MALKDDLLHLIREAPGLSDGELAKRLPTGALSLARQVNAACLGLVKAGMIRREKRDDGLMASFPSGSESMTPAPTPALKNKAGAGLMRTGIRLNWQEVGEAVLSASGEVSLPPLEKASGLLRIEIGEDRVVIDSSENLRRCVKNIVDPGPKQASSALVRKQILKALKDGKTVTLALCAGASLDATDAERPVDLSDKAARAMLRKTALLIESSLGRQTLKTGT